MTKDAAEDDGDDNVAVVGHGNQHDQVSTSELDTIQKRTQELLPHFGSEAHRVNGGLSAARLASGNAEEDGIELVHLLAQRQTVLRWLCFSQSTGHLSLEVLGAAPRFPPLDQSTFENPSVKLATPSSHRLDQEYHQKDTDAGAGELRFGPDVP